METKIITCTGFYATGSSAVTDILSDCDNVLCKGDYEVRILHDPYCVSDLEYNLIENPNRHNTSNAIKNFKKLVDFYSNFLSGKTCQKYFNYKFKEISYEYINDICDFQYFGKWHMDLYEKGRFFSFVSRSYNKVIVSLKKLFGIRDEKSYDLLPKREVAFAGTMSEEKFLHSTKKYISQLINTINEDKVEYVMVDQLVPPTNTVRYSRYVENLKIILVERDPRDLYIAEKYIYKGTVIPVYDIDLFCKWYDWTRSQAAKNGFSNNTIRINFEDIIYKNEKTVDTILSFVGIEKQHYHPNKFNPDKSKKNTQLWYKYDEEQNIKIIEDRLKKYLYDFD